MTVDGLDVLTHTREVQARIGYLPENAPLYPELSVQGYLKMMADLRQIPRGEQRARISEAVYATGLAEHLTRPIGTLSKGFRQRVGLAQAILHRPKLLILDEPTVGLDPTQIVEIRRLIHRLAERTTILFSTHILSEVEALCDRAIILINGLVKADARLADLEETADAVLVLGKQGRRRRALPALAARGARHRAAARAQTATRPTGSWGWATWTSAPPSTTWPGRRTGRCASCAATCARSKRCSTSLATGASRRGGNDDEADACPSPAKSWRPTSARRWR